MFRTLALMTLLATIAVGSAVAEPLVRDFQRTFDVEPGVVLHLEHGDGDVVLETSDRDQIEVDVHFEYDVKDWSIGGSDREFNVDFDQRGDHIYVREEFTGGGVSIGIHASIRKDYTYTIKVPSYASLDLEGDDGNVEIRGVAAALRLQNDDGDVRLSECDFDLADIEMEDGELELLHCGGNIEVQSEDGDIDFVDCDPASLVIEAEDSDVRLELTNEGEVDWDVRIDDGDLDVEFGSNLSAEIYLETDDGRLRIDIPSLEDVRERRDRIRGRLGDGAGTIRFRTEDGGISVREYHTNG